MEMCRADGNRVWISLTVRPVRDKEGQVVASRAAAEDITERKRMEKALRESEQDLNRVQAAAHTGNWRLDVRRILPYSEANSAPRIRMNAERYIHTSKIIAAATDP